MQVLMLEDLPDTQRWLSGIVKEAVADSVVAVAGTLEQAHALLPTRCWGLMLVDLGLPDGSGIDFLHVLRQRQPQVPAVVTTIFDDDDNLFGALAAGACGYLLKSQPREVLVRELNMQQHGHVPISPGIARRLMVHFQQRAMAQRAPTEAGLNPRELQVLTLIAQGLRTREVAARLELTENTVSTYVRELYDKLGISNRAEAVGAAAELGLIDD